MSFPQVKTDSSLQNGIYKTNQLIYISVSNKLGMARDSTVGTYLAKIIPVKLSNIKIGSANFVRHFPSLLLFTLDCHPPPPPQRLHVQLRWADDFVRLEILPWVGLGDWRGIEYAVSRLLSMSSWIVTIIPYQKILTENGVIQRVFSWSRVILLRISLGCSSICLVSPPYCVWIASWRGPGPVCTSMVDDSAYLMMDSRFDQSPKVREQTCVF